MSLCALQFVCAGLNRLWLAHLNRKKDEAQRASGQTYNVTWGSEPLSEDHPAFRYPL